MRTVPALLLSLCLAACGSGGTASVHPPPTSPSPLPGPPTSLTIEELDPPTEASWTEGEECIEGRAPEEDEVVIDFEDQILVPAAGGRFTRTAPFLELPPSRMFVAMAAGDELYRLRACYRWARHARPTLSGELRVALRFDPVGRVERPVVTSEVEGADELAECVTDVLSTLALPVPAATPVHAEVRLHFVTHPATTLPRARPERPTPRSDGRWSRGCVRTRVGAAPARLLPVFLLVHDFDRSAENREARRLRRTRRQLRIRTSGSMRARLIYHHRSVRSAIRTNTGAYRRCTADAVARTPGLSGRIYFEMELDGRGRFGSVEARESELDDPELASCLQAALLEVRVFSLFQQRTRIRFPFLVRSSAVEPLRTGRLEDLADNARALLEEERGDLALARFDALAEARPDLPEHCSWSQGALEAAALVEPWGDGPHTERAARRLIAVLRGDGVSDECRRTGGRVLARYAQRRAEPLMDDSLLYFADQIVETFGPLLEPPAVTEDPGLQRVFETARRQLQRLEPPRLAEPERRSPPCMREGEEMILGEDWTESCHFCGCGLDGPACLRFAECPDYGAGD